MQESAESSLAILIQRLQDFITNFYLQKLLKGFLQLVLVFICIYLVTATLEYNLYFSSQIRMVLYWLFLLSVVILSAYWIGFPLYQYINYKARISEKVAAEIIGNHFPEVKDKLLNVLLLREMQYGSKTTELIDASIAQKSQSLRIVKFNEAIDWAKNKKLGKYLIFPILLFVLILLVFPNLVNESTYRIIHYKQKFSPKAPFKFKVENKSLKVSQFDPLEVVATLQGKSLPLGMNMIYNDVSYPMTLNSLGQFTATIKSVESASNFKFEAAGFYSDEYDIEIIPKPIISGFTLEIIPPSYTGQKSYSQKNIGEINAPEGSVAIWKFQTENVDQISIKVNQRQFPTEKYINGYGTKLMLKNLSSYQVLYKNNYSIKIDSQSYTVSLTRDAHPMVYVNEFKDSLNDILYYAGDVSDDYGVSSLKMICFIEGKNTNYSVLIPKGKNASFQFSTRDIFNKFPKGSDLRYYFEVWDNDAINGPKSSRSATFQYKKLGEKEIHKLLEKNTSEIQANLARNIKDAKDLQKQLDAARKKMLEKATLDYNDKKNMEDLVNKQKELQQRLEEIKKELERNFDKKNELTKQDKSILEQQKQLNEMMDQMKNSEMNELLKKIEQLLDKSEKKEMMKTMDKMDQKSEKMEKNMDRLLQLYKNLDYKQKVNDMIEKLDKLGKEQEKTALETELDKNTSEKQKEVSKDLKEAEKKMDEIIKLNQELNKSDKKEMEEIKKELESAEESQKEAEKELEKNDKEDAAEKQRNAAEKLNSAKDKLKKLKKKQKNNQKKEDARMMRRVLENVIYLSFEQEKLINSTKKISTQSPSYPKIGQKQKSLLEDFRIVEDTLYKIASRQPKVKKMIFEEVDKINQNSERAIQRLVERQSNQAISDEQFAMAAYNKLGLMLSESLKNIEAEEEEDENEMGSDASCDNPKNGKKKKQSMNLDKLAEMQSQLNEQMEELKKKMDGKKEGDKAEGKKPGEKEGSGSEGKNGKDGSTGSDAKEMARIAAQQQAIRNALKEIEESVNHPDKSGKKPMGNQLKDIMDKMNQTERDVVNKNIREETLKRQKEIQVKLLESAKSEREQDEEMKRESERAKSIPPEMPKELKEYIKEKKKNEVQIQRTPVGLTPYFKSLAEKYFQLIK